MYNTATQALVKTFFDRERKNISGFPDPPQAHFFMFVILQQLLLLGVLILQQQLQKPMINY